MEEDVEFRRHLEAAGWTFHAGMNQ